MHNNTFENSILVYILPAHNESKIITSKLEEIDQTYSKTVQKTFCGIIDNGCSDNTAEIVARYCSSQVNSKVHYFLASEKSAGIGYAYARGINEVLRLIREKQIPYEPKNIWILLSAADLPFGMTDVEQWKLNFSPNEKRIFVGSKAHEFSKVNRSWKRYFASQIFKLLRLSLFQSKVADTQGTIIARLDILEQISKLIVSRNYFYSTELLLLAERLGHSVFEIPVCLIEDNRASKVKIFRDSYRMLKQTLSLRWRFWTQKNLPMKKS